MDWNRLLVEKRFWVPKADTKEKKDGRSQFEKDIDRITFSSAFRRLGRKTQVHLLSKDDHIHTRLSHSLEAACVGRSLGVMVGQWLKDEKERELFRDIFSPSKVGEIVQAAFLAHDIGNPPFGHVADKVIRKWFQEDMNSNGIDWTGNLTDSERLDLKYFDGNAMAFRVVTYKEHYKNSGGMRLTYPTLGAMLKYPWTSHFAESKDKFSCFKTEYSNLCEVAAELRLTEKTRNESESKAKYARHPLAYLVEAADDICYRVLDMEDAIGLKLLPQDIFDQQFKEYLTDKLDREQQRLLKGGSGSWSIKNGLLRGKMIGLMIEEIVRAFKENYDRIMEGSLKSSLLSETHSNSLCLGIKAFYKKANLKKVIYQNQKNVLLELGAYSALETLLEASTKAASEIYKDKDISYKTEIIIKFIKEDGEKQFKGKTLHEIIILFLDYVTGMTDNYATSVNKQLLGLGACPSNN